MTEREIDKISLKIKESNTKWISDIKERQGLLESTIKSGDVLQLGKLISYYFFIQGKYKT
jgi:hypothetical protein